jgi:hypothetical protein
MATVKRVTTLDRPGLIAVCDHLLGEGRDRFLLSATGRMYAAPIAAAARVLARPAPTPVVAVDAEAEALRAQQARGRAIANGLTAVSECPEFDAETRSAATRVLAAFGSRPTVRATAAARVEQAAAVRAEMATLADDLARLPTAPGGETFAAWIERWCDAGSAFADGLIAAALEDEAPSRDARRSRGTAMGRVNGLLVRARVALRDEISFDETLPRTLETELFGLYDQLFEARRAQATTAARRAGASATPTPPAPAADPAPVADPTPPAPAADPAPVADPTPPVA